MKDCDLSCHFLDVLCSGFVSRKRAAHSVADGDAGMSGCGDLESADSRHLWCRHCGFDESV
jgi:hypothetical protein